uniref:Uncharacterized protein n=1 Tax=Nelumbo nucifera TaxID=4432 RepID=A0A822Y932_NELNU|nr:TPA_asm: hypothetical protein HUJ06_009425 [Nelumbo nucifera]
MKPTQNTLFSMQSPLDISDHAKGNYPYEGYRKLLVGDSITRFCVSMYVVLCHNSLYFGNYYRKDPRERAGLAASAIAVLSLARSLTHARAPLSFVF